MSGSGSPDLARFAEIVKARRDALGLTQGQARAVGGPTNSTFTKIENMQWAPGRQGTLQKLDDALRWTKGSSARILYEGGDPTPSDQEPLRADEATSTQATADHAIGLSVLLETISSTMWSTLGDKLPPAAGRALHELDAAAYIAERLALQLAGSSAEYADRRQVARAKVRARLEAPAAQPASAATGEEDPFDWLVAPSPSDWALANEDDEHDPS